jgi:hypothetical protein
MTTLQADGLIPFLIFVAFAIIASLFEKRAKREKQQERNPLPGQPRRKSWEEELNDLLKQQQPAPPPMRREVPAPPPAAYVPPPVYAPLPPPIPDEEDRGIEVYFPTTHRKIDPVFQPMHGLSVADERHAHAASLQQRVEQHMASVTRRTAGTTQVERHEVSGRTHDAVELVRSRHNLRGAVLASIILGPPRALEPMNQ